MRNKYKIIGFYMLLFAAWMLFEGNASNPPNGRTNAPFDSFCTGCHNPSGSIMGTVEISGVPEMVEAGETYAVTLTVSVTGGNAARAGFQLVSVFDADNTNAGDLIASSSEMGTNDSGGREYIEHRGAQNFNNNSASWTFDWMAPNGPDGAAITMYYAGNITNGNGSSSGDRPVSGSSAFTLSAQVAPLVAEVSDQINVMCTDDNTGQATVTVSGGTMPYTYLWSNGVTSAMATDLAAGEYTVTVTDDGGMETTVDVIILQQDVLGPDIPTAPVTLYLDANGEATYDADPLLAMIMDNCGVEATTVSQEAFSCADLGIQNIQITATDGGGNVSNGDVEVTVLDTVAPTFVQCVEDMEVSLGDTVRYEMPVAMDNCALDSLVMTEGLASGSVFPEGETKVSYMATDASGNISCCSFFVTAQMTTDVSENDLEKNLTVFPNPAIEVIKIDLDRPVTGDLRMAIFSLTGGTIFQSTNLEPNSSGYFEIDLSEIPVGAYLLQINQGQLSATRRIIVLESN
ncbi:MAG: HYR domain-containing protein [Saprospiraceae bacterium]|nr:HYR domain-containing protein [Saprospiraceae bacterium]